MLVQKTIVVRVNSCQNLAAAKMHMLLSHLSGVQIGLQQGERDRRVFCTSILAEILCKVVGVSWLDASWLQTSGINGRGWQAERCQTRKVRASQGRMPDNVRWRRLQG